VEIVANEVGFTARVNGDGIYTWGDERFPACLGREPQDYDIESATPEFGPASHPHLVQEFADCEVKKMSSGGYATAVLTSTSDVFFWGRFGLLDNVSCSMR